MKPWRPATFRPNISPDVSQPIEIPGYDAPGLFNVNPLLVAKGLSGQKSFFEVQLIRLHFKYFAVMTIQLNSVDQVEILTLQDNTIDIIPKDNTDIITRARLIDSDFNVRGSVLAEHGFSCLVTVTKGAKKRQLLFDFGFSPFGAAHNADILGIDLSNVALLCLSHGHFDHTGGLLELADRIGNRPIDLVLHPAALRQGRGKRINAHTISRTPGLNVEEMQSAGIRICESRDPLSLLDGDVLFLGEIPRTTEFEKVEQGRVYLEKGEDLDDDLADDTSLVFNVRGKGLVLLSGCAHAGIVNSLHHAVRVTGIEPVLAVMGGFHLSGREALINPTIEGLRAFNPDYVVPTHCTGRVAVNRFEQEMGDRFLLNMAGTSMCFSADP